MNPDLPVSNAGSATNKVPEPPSDSPALLALLIDWLPGQRWFAGTAPEAASLGILQRAPVTTVGNAAVELVLLTVDAGTGRTIYQLLLGWRTDVPDWVEHAIIGAVGQHICYDALHDHEITGAFLAALSTGKALGPIDVIIEPNADIDPSLPGLVINAEQSNTSIVYGDKVMVKFFRRPTPGLNPDAELLSALSSCPYSARPFGELRTAMDGTFTTLALATNFFANSADGWAMATASVRDLFAEGDLHADEVGGDFAAESYRLGEAVATVHRYLADALGTVNLNQSDVETQLSAMTAQAIQLAGSVPALAEHLEPIRATLTRLEKDITQNLAANSVATQRIHGDLHLGQALRTVQGWVLIDFEGEPSRTVSERRSMKSPLRDVAGMVRSLDYAAHQLFATGTHDAQQTYRATEWAARNKSAFLDGYTAAAGADPRENLALLTAFELGKAIYEVGYEHDHRPGWVHIPLAAIAELTAAP